MPAVRGVNLRSGDLNEEFGLQLLRNIGAVAPVPRTEDVGIDAFVTLLPRDGPLYKAAETFLVQLKSRSVTHVFFDSDDIGRKSKSTRETRWLRSIAYPMFFAKSSQIEEGVAGRLSLYSNNNLLIWLHTNPENHGVGICFEQANAVPAPDPDHVPVVWLGHPAIEFSLADIAVDAERSERIELLSEWISSLQTNINMGPLGMLLQLQWQTNEPPEKVSFHVGMGALTPERRGRIHSNAVMSCMPFMTERLTSGDEPGAEAVLAVLRKLSALSPKFRLNEEMFEVLRQQSRLLNPPDG